MVSIAAGMAAMAAIQLATNPGTWNRLPLLWDTALDGGLFYALVPSLILAVIAMRGKPPGLSTAACIFVGWLTLIFAWWAAKPIRVYGGFPWWGFRLHFLEMLPLPLASALAFAICSRKLFRR
jgi:hypothetical protein